MKSNKILQGIIKAVNIIGIMYLIYYAVPFIIHDTTIANPNSMLRFQRWEGSGLALTLGLIPLAIANLLGFLLVNVKQKNLRKVFFVPSIICFVIVVIYWVI